ncbi:unnamed protein product, partial [Staurois parvus]
MGVGTVAKVARETCLALWEELHSAVMPVMPPDAFWSAHNTHCAFLLCVDVFQTRGGLT